MTIEQIFTPYDVPFDIAIIGGGINGCGIARDAAGRGLSVYLCEQNDLASGTSSWSTKLIHGGLRYLEHYEFRLVREALIEREILWLLAPHIIRPLRFVLPAHKGLRPAWLLRLGLFLYDHLGGRKLLPATKTLDLTTDVTGKPLKPGTRIGFEYSDCRVDDARLVVLNAMDARDRGAVIETHTKLIQAHREDGLWVLTIEAKKTGQRKTLRTKALINAAGPWVADVLETKITSDEQAKVRLVQGSHIVVRKLYDHDRAYIFQNADGRIVFAIPYEGDFTLIGTTDHDYVGDPAKVHATDDEIAYLLSAAGEYFTQPITRDDVVWTFSGVRPLYDDGASKAQEATRDYVLRLETRENAAPLLSIFGGKITTYRRLAEATLEHLYPFFPGLSAKAGWTAKSRLPGGDVAVSGIDALIEKLCNAHPELKRALIARLVHTYGTRTADLLGNAQTHTDLGQAFGSTLTEREITYLRQQEWAETVEDVLWRRTKLGLKLSATEQAALATFMQR